MRIASNEAWSVSDADHQRYLDGLAVAARRRSEAPRAAAPVALNGWLVAFLSDAANARRAVDGAGDAPLGDWRAPTRREVVTRRAGASRYSFLTRGEPPRKRVVVERPLFPGYAFIRPRPHVSWHTVEALDGIVRLVGKAKDGGPAMLSDEAYGRLVGDLSLLRAANPALTTRLRVAMLVRLLNGPFTGFNGVVETVTPARIRATEQGEDLLREERVKVGVSMFGQTTRIAMAADDVEVL